MRSRFVVGVSACVMAVAGAALPQDDAAGEEAVPKEEETSFFSNWDGGVAFGLIGASGNSEFYTFNAQIDALRKTDENETTFLAKYTRGQGDSPPNGNSELQNRGEVRARNDWLFPESKWFAFGEGVYEYDEFQDWASRVQLFAGPGYVWVDSDKTTFKTRVGVGAVREFLGSDNAWRAEGIISADLRHQITERQLFTAVVDVFPNLGDSRLYRVRSRAQWEIIVDPEVNLTLKIGVEDRYDMEPGVDNSTPPMALKRNDVEYFVLLGWSF